MTELQKALKLWLGGNTQSDFAEASGIERSLVSRMIAGERRLGTERGALLLAAFAERGLEREALMLIRADLADSVPEGARPHIRVVLLPGREDAFAGMPPHERARRRMMGDLASGEPDAVAVAAALYADLGNVAGGNAVRRRGRSVGVGHLLAGAEEPPGDGQPEGGGEDAGSHTPHQTAGSVKPLKKKS